MQIKKKFLLLLIGALCVCILPTFGFQIDVAGSIDEDGGTAEVTLIEPLRVAAGEASVALLTAQQAADDANTALEAAQKTFDDAIAIQAALQATAAPEEIAAAQKAVDDATTILAAAQQVSYEAGLALSAAQLTADEANAAYLTLIAKNEGELLALLELQHAADEANTALLAFQQTLDETNAIFAALPDTATPEEIATAQQTIDDAIAALTVAQQMADEANASLGEAVNGEIKVSHIITNSNNGGSFAIGGEGNHFAVDGDMLSFNFASEEGFDLAWLRIGNEKIVTTGGTDLISYLESFYKKNLTIHAHFKKDKDYVPETIVETTSSGEEILGGDENNSGSKNGNGKENNNGNGKENDNGKNKEKSNNGGKKK